MRSREILRRLAVVAVVAAALFPLVAASPASRADATQALALLLGATALNLVMGWTGQPSLGHGALMGIGAYAYVLLRADAGLGPVAGVVAGVALALLTGLVVGRAVGQLRAPFVALTTWVVAWAFWAALGSFPTLSGGTAGTVVPQARVDSRVFGLAVRVSPVVLYEVALVAVVLAIAALTTGLRRFGPALAAQREDPMAAEAAGVDVVRLRVAAFVLSAGVAGLAGVLDAQVAGVADPTTFRPLLSVELFLVVLVGGAGETFGPVVGLAALAVVSSVAGALGHVFGVTGDTVEPLAVALLLGLVLAVGRRGLVPLLRARLRPGARVVAGAPVEASDSAPPPRPRARIEARDVSVSFEGLRALDAVTFSAGPGGCHALIGPNGSGKTTLLRVLAGGLRPSAGQVLLDGLALGEEAPHERARAGIVRTLQGVALAPELTDVDHVVSGMEPVREVGLLQAVTSTPQAREEERTVVREARVILDGLGALSAVPRQAGTLSVGERRFVQLARALAARPTVLLLDEPSAGLDEPSTRRLLQALEGAKEAGTTIVLVAHDLALVRAVADTVTVLDAGTVIARGTAEEVASAPRVVAAYLGE